MANIQIALFNQSATLQDADIQAALPALQTQVHRDFAPVWGVDADLTFYTFDSSNPAYQPIPATSWQLGVFDSSDQAGALGYHDLTESGLPLGKIFAGTDKQYGEQWTVTASHELLEMLGDPDINLTAMGPSDGAPSSECLYAYEVCDACEADASGYYVGTVLVSDFVYPAWFESFRAGRSAQFDQQNKITQPFQLLPGGYIGILNLTGALAWTQITAQGAPHEYKALPRVGSRRQRRSTPRSRWLRSKPKR